MDLFKTNDLANIKIEEFNGSKIYSMDNFYVNPDEVVKFILANEPLMHKPDTKNSKNGIWFLDKRHEISYDAPFIQGLEKIVNQKAGCKDKLITNYTIFHKNEANDYKNNYFWPHRDEATTCLIYLSKSVSHTNIYYDYHGDKSYGEHTEHSHPWRSKKDWVLTKQLVGSYNKMIMFDTKRFYHSMDVNDTFFNEYRLNQVIRFIEND
jgi:hypothetical protein